MINQKRTIVVMPAYNAARTLERTVAELPEALVDEIILTDDASADETAALGEALGLTVLRHDRNRGYGANQKTCYRAALERDADIVIMLHPDYQYSPRLVCALAAMLAYGEYDCVLASRILGKGALPGGMPRYKYLANRGLTLAQNLLLSQRMSEYHSGYRAWSRDVLLRLPLLNCSDDFVFDNQMLAQAFYFGFRVGEISCPTKYIPEASSINLARSCRYGAEVMATSLSYRLQRMGVSRAAFLQDREASRLRPVNETSGTFETDGVPFALRFAK